MQISGYSFLIWLACFGEQVTENRPHSKVDARPRVEVVFVLDSTGSMSSLIQTAKEKIWSIATSMTQAEPAPDIWLGLVTYRDRGDAYITKKTGLTGDLDDVSEQLMAYQAGGGGDSPESVNEALDVAISQTEWDRDPNTYKVIFLVGDCPPHMDYEDDVKYQVSCARAAETGIIINTIQMGQFRDTTPIWKEIAKRTQGQYLMVDRDASGLMVSSPYDKSIADLSDKLDGTCIYYGTKAEKRAQIARKEKARVMSGDMSDAAKARRGAFNQSVSGSLNFVGHKELISDLNDGTVRLDDLSDYELPAEMQSMTAAEQRGFVTGRRAQRAALKEELTRLSDLRQAHIEAQLEGDDSLSEKVYRTIKRQAKEKGIEYKGHAKH